MLWHGTYSAGERWTVARRAAVAELLTAALPTALATAFTSTDRSGAAGENFFLSGSPDLSPLTGRRLSLELTLLPSDEVREVCWAAQTPLSLSPSFLRIRALDTRGKTFAGVLLATERTYRRADVARALEASVGSGQVRDGQWSVLHSETLPPAKVVWTGSLPQARGVFRCANPTCPSRGAERVVPLAQSLLQRLTVSPLGLPLYPCPSCVGAPGSGWALTFVRGERPGGGNGTPCLIYPVLPQLPRRLPVEASLPMAAGVPAEPAWGSVWDPTTVRAPPVALLRLRRVPRLAAAFDALMQGSSVGASAAWCLDPNNVRALVEYCRAQPAALQARVVDGLAALLQPRRTADYRTELDHGESGAQHYPYIAYPPQGFFGRLKFFGFVGSEALSTHKPVGGSTGGLRFLDVGCGVGEKPFLAHALGGFERCDGFDFNAATVAVAHYLLGMLRGERPYPINIFEGNAFEFDRYADYDLIYMFRPLRDKPLMGTLLTYMAQQMAPGAVLFDAIDTSLALHRGLDGAFYTYDHAQTERAVWSRPVSLPDFVASVGLAPEAEPNAPS